MTTTQQPPVEPPMVFRLFLRSGQVWERGQPWPHMPGSAWKVDRIVSSIFLFEEEAEQAEETDEAGNITVPFVPAKDAHYLVIGSGKFPMMPEPCDPRDPEALHVKPVEGGQAALLFPKDPEYANHPVFIADDKKARKVGIFVSGGLGVQTEILAADVLRAEFYMPEAAARRLEAREARNLLRAAMEAEAVEADEAPKTETPKIEAPKPNGGSIPNFANG